MNMNDKELLAYCGQQLMNMSNGLPVGDPPDYSTLLESLQKLRYLIRSYQNDQVPINRLPAEILMLICKLTLPSDPELTAPDNKRVFCVAKLTHVCRHWRLVLISSSLLWTSFHVVKTAPKFIAECLQRSGTLPIHVSFKWDSEDPDYDSPSTSVADDDGSVASNGDGSVVPDDIDQISSSKFDDSDNWTVSRSTLSIYPDHRDAGYSWTAYIKEAQGYHHLMQHSHRIATLDITLPALGDDVDEDNPFACGLLSYPFPALRTLSLRCFWGRRGSIPRVILDEHITAVNTLILENIFPTQIVDFALDLTSITLMATAGLDTPFDTSSFLRFLEKNRNLRSLALHNCKFLTIPDSTNPVALSNLRQLDVSGVSVAFLRYLSAPPLGPQSSFRMKRMHQRLLLWAENRTSETSTSVSFLLPSTDPNPNGFLSSISEVFSSGWEEATRVAVVIPIGGWERELVDQFLDRLAKLDELSVECDYDCVDPWFDSLAISKERCPKLREVRLLHIAPEYCPTAVKSVRKLVKRRAEDGIPLEMVEQTGLSSSAKDIWDTLYDQWRIKDYLKTRGS